MMKLVTGVMLGVLAAWPVMGFAEDAEQKAPEWKSNLSLGATYKSGNADKSLFTMNLKADRFGAHNDVISSLYAEYGESGTVTAPKERTEGQVRGQSQYRHKFGESKFFAGVFVEGYNDSIKQIRFRGKVGPNIGYYFIDQKTVKLDASVGLNYVYERTAADERTFGEYRAAANFLWEFNENGSYYLNLEYTANMEDTDVDNQGLLVTGVKSRVHEDLALFVELRDEYDNEPDAVGLEYNDVTVMAGLSYDF